MNFLQVVLIFYGLFNITYSGNSDICFKKSNKKYYILEQSSSNKPFTCNWNWRGSNELITQHLKNEKILRPFNSHVFIINTKSDDVHSKCCSTNFTNMINDDEINKINDDKKNMTNDDKTESPNNDDDQYNQFMESFMKNTEISECDQNVKLYIILNIIQLAIILLLIIIFCILYSKKRIKHDDTIHMNRLNSIVKMECTEVDNDMYCQKSNLCSPDDEYEEIQPFKDNNEMCQQKINDSSLDADEYAEIKPF